jgi:hypothetical protein
MSPSGRLTPNFDVSLEVPSAMADPRVLSRTVVEGVELLLLTPFSSCLRGPMPKLP